MHMRFLSYNFSLISTCLIALLCATLYVTPFFAQQQIDDQVHGWLVYQGNHHLSTKFDLHTEYQWRRADGFSFKPLTARQVPEFSQPHK
mgnify:CR=1 FL=1